MEDCLFKTSAASLTAWATLGLLIATVILAMVAGYQVSTLRDENRKERTLNACMKYDADPILVMSIQALRKGRTDGTIKTRTPEFRSDIVCLLNYFDLLAVGVRDRLYSERIVRGFMDPLILDEFTFYADGGVIAAAKTEDPHTEIKEENYAELAWLVKRWKETPQKKSYSSKVLAWLRDFPPPRPRPNANEPR